MQFFKYLSFSFIFLWSGNNYCQERAIDRSLNFVLLNAIYEKQLSEVEYYLENGADVNSSDVYDVSALMYSVLSEEIEIINLLFDYGARVNARDFYGMNALMYAILGDNDQVIDLILQQQPNINSRTQEGQTALMFAAQTGNLNVAKQLIENGALVNAVDENGVSALMYATAFGHFFIIDLLLFYQADLELAAHDGTLPLHLAAFYGHHEIAGLLLDSGAEIDAADHIGLTPLMVAIMAQDHHTVWYFIESGASLEAINQKGHSTLALAVGNDDVEMIRLLNSYIYEEPEVTNKKVSPLAIAYYRKNREIVDILLEMPKIQPQGLYISEWLFDAGFNFNNNDFMYGFSTGLFEARYGMMGRMSFHKRFNPRAVNMIQDDGIIYRYLEDRIIWGLGFQKDFSLLRSRNIELGVLAGLVAQYTYGSYNGTTLRPDPRFMVSPLLDAYFKNRGFYLFGSFSFLRTGVTDIPATRFQAGIRFSIPAHNRRYMTYSPIIR
jgi:ankyrin repeat protein